MHKSWPMLLAAVPLVAIGWFVGGAAPSTAQAPREDAAQQWEYQSSDASAVNVPRYNALGKDGWELVTIAHVRSDEFVAVFKRPKR